MTRLTVVAFFVLLAGCSKADTSASDTMTPAMSPSPAPTAMDTTAAKEAQMPVGAARCKRCVKEEPICTKHDSKGRCIESKPQCVAFEPVPCPK